MRISKWPNRQGTRDGACMRAGCKVAAAQHAQTTQHEARKVVHTPPSHPPSAPPHSIERTRADGAVLDALGLLQLLQLRKVRVQRLAELQQRLVPGILRACATQARSQLRIETAHAAVASAKLFTSARHARSRVMRAGHRLSQTPAAPAAPGRPAQCCCRAWAACCSTRRASSSLSARRRSAWHSGTLRQGVEGWG